MAAAAEVEIKRCICVHGPMDTAPWMISDTEVIDGTDFVALKRRDVGFCRFVAGKDWRKIPSMSFLNELQRKRTAETILSCQSTSLFDDALPTQAARKRARHDASKKADCGELKPWLSLSLPQLVCDDGTVVPACVIKVKSSLDTKEAVVVDLSVSTLSYIRKAMMMSQKPEENIYAKKDGARWRSDRNCWTVSREEDGKAVKKAFKPKGDADEAVLDARDAAVAWSQGFDCPAESPEADSCDEVPSASPEAEHAVA